MTISVVVPLYNKAAYIAAALHSILTQTRRPEEIIVVDDGSTDDGAAIAGAIRGVTLIRQPNGGVSAARNTGIMAAGCSLVAFLDADDLWAPDHLALIEMASEAYPDAALLCTGYRRFNAAGTVSEHIGAPGIVPSFYALWSRGPFTCTNSIAVRREVLLSLGTLFPLGERVGEDQDVWFRMADAAPVAHVAVLSAQYRVDAANNSGSAEMRDLLPCYRRLGERLAAGKIPAREAAGARRLLATHMINVARTRAKAGDKAGARALLLTRHAASNPVYWARSLLDVL